MRKENAAARTNDMSERKNNRELCEENKAGERDCKRAERGDREPEETLENAGHQHKQ